RPHYHDPVASAAGQFQPGGSGMGSGVGRAVTGGHERGGGGGGGGPAPLLPPRPPHQQRGGPAPAGPRPGPCGRPRLWGGCACYFVTAAGLPGVRVPARIVLVVAGLSSIGIAVSPEPVRGSTPQHLAWTSLGAVAITVWPAFTARRAPSQPLILRARGAGAVTAVFLALLAWVVFETQGGTALGLAERLVSAVQVTWPFVVALALRRAVGQAAPSALRRAAAGGTQAGSWGDVFVDGGAAGAEQPGDGGDGVVRPGQQVAGGADLLGGHGRRPPHSAGAAHP